MKIIIIESTFSSREEVDSIANVLLHSKLIACAQIIPIESLYFWKGQIMNDTEFKLSVKTIAEKRELVIQSIVKSHSYELPEIISQEVVTTENYGSWCFASCQG